MDRRNYFLIVLVIAPLIVVAAVLRSQRSERQASDLQRLRESERALQMKANPLPYVRDGMAVEEVENALGRGEPVVDDGEDLLLWYGAGNRELWTLVVTVKDSQVSRPTMMVGGASGDHQFRKQAAISLHRQRGGPPGQDAEERKRAEPMPGAGEPGELPRGVGQGKPPKNGIE
jgi:hypothetical protein